MAWVTEVAIGAGTTKRLRAITRIGLNRPLSTPEEVKNRTIFRETMTTGKIEGTLRKTSECIVKTIGVTTVMSPETPEEAVTEMTDVDTIETIAAVAAISVIIGKNLAVIEIVVTTEALQIVSSAPNTRTDGSQRCAETATNGLSGHIRDASSVRTEDPVTTKEALAGICNREISATKLVLDSRTEEMGRRSRGTSLGTRVICVRNYSA